MNETKIRSWCKKKEECLVRDKHPPFNDEKEENVTFPIRLGRVSHSISFHPFALSLLQIDRQVMNREEKKRGSSLLNI
jgi:hypothetical protein